MNFLTEDEVEKLATAITYPENHPSGRGAAPSGRTEFPEYGLFVRFAAHAGPARASSGSLRTCPLDLLRRRVEVTESLSEVKGRLVFGPTKTYLTRIRSFDAGRRHLSIHQKVPPTWENWCCQTPNRPQGRRHLLDATIIAQVGRLGGVFDDRNAVANAGLVLPMTLAERLGLKN